MPILLASFVFILMEIAVFIRELRIIIENELNEYKIHHLGVAFALNALSLETSTRFCPIIVNNVKLNIRIIFFEVEEKREKEKYAKTHKMIYCNRKIMF